LIIQRKEGEVNEGRGTGRLPVQVGEKIVAVCASKSLVRHCEPKVKQSRPLTRDKLRNLGVCDINRPVIASSQKNAPRNDHPRLFGKLLSSSPGLPAGFLGAAWPAFRAGTGTAVLVAAAAGLPAAPVRSQHDCSSTA